MTRDLRSPFAHGGFSQKPLAATLTPTAEELADTYGLRGRGHSPSRSERLAEYFRLRAEGLSPYEAAAELGLDVGSRSSAGDRFEHFVIDWHEHHGVTT